MYRKESAEVVIWLEGLLSTSLRRFSGHGSTGSKPRGWPRTHWRALWPGIPTQDKLKGVTERVASDKMDGACFSFLAIYLNLPFWKTHLVPISSLRLKKNCHGMWWTVSQPVSELARGWGGVDFHIHGAFLELRLWLHVLYMQNESSSINWQSGFSLGQRKLKEILCPSLCLLMLRTG